MKNPNKFLVYLIFASSSILAQEETLFNGKIEHGGFGGPVVKLTKVHDDLSLLVGGRGGWIINHTLVIGCGVNGLVTPVSKIQVTTDSTMQLEFVYGGIEVEYIYRSNRLIHSTL